MNLRQQDFVIRIAKELEMHKFQIAKAMMDTNIRRVKRVKKIGGVTVAAEVELLYL